MAGLAHGRSKVYPPGVLEMEKGLHIAEEGGLGDIARVQITLAAQVPGPESLLPGPLSKVAAKALQAAQSTDILRRYQAKPTPLVHDRRRDFRTGRLDLVLAGHFDLMNGA